ncbi:MAG: hypothetical protein MUW51_01610 [Lactococcus lactis]|nr:hypothetical protein [Lactococcus lactis]
MGAIIRFMTNHHLPFPEDVGSEKDIYAKASISKELIDKFTEYLLFVGRKDLLKEFQEMVQNNNNNFSKGNKYVSKKSKHTPRKKIK